MGWVNFLLMITMRNDENRKQHGRNNHDKEAQFREDRLVFLVGTSEKDVPHTVSAAATFTGRLIR